MITRFEINTRDKPPTSTPRDPFRPQSRHRPDPDRLTENGTLDTFLHRIRLELLQEERYRQNRSDNLTRKERQSIKNLATNPNIVINKADKGSTIVVEDREEYVSNAMEHLNNPDVYQPLKEDTSHILKERITEKLTLLHKHGLLKKTWFEYCKPPEKTRTSRLYFLKKIHKTPMAMRPIVSNRK